MFVWHAQSSFLAEENGVRVCLLQQREDPHTHCIEDNVMKTASTLAVILALVSLPLPAQDRDTELMRTVRQLPANVLDPVAFPVTSSLERVFSIYTRVPVVALEWEVNDCGEGGDGRKASTCVEVRAELAPEVAAWRGWSWPSRRWSRGSP